MREAKVKSVRALERGLLVVETVQALGTASLAELHARTALPRATILRSLRTLQEQGWITSNDRGTEYRLGPKMAGAAVAPSKATVAELALPVLQRLSELMAFPADVAVRRGTRMLIIQSSRRWASFPINSRPEGRQPCLLRSALGRAYLAFCPDDEREKLINLLEKSTDPDDRPAGLRKWVDRMLEECRKQGYGVREADYWAGAEDFGAEVSAIAVPVELDDKVVACINLMWVSGTADTREFANRNLPALRGAARELASAMKANSIGSHASTAAKALSRAPF